MLEDKHEQIREAFTKWIPRLGLAWWDIEIAYYDDPVEILSRFRAFDDSNVAAATVNVQWYYGKATIAVNLPALADLGQEQIERIAVHELMHILINEMREDGILHEERVVTQLTKAIFWVRDAIEADLIEPFETETQKSGP